MLPTSLKQSMPRTTSRVTSSDATIHAFEQIATDFASRFGNLNDVRESAKQVLAALSEYSSQKTTVVSKINHSPILSFEYTYTNQSSINLPSSTTQDFSVQQTPPHLS